jgi:hypothetical protein
MNQSARCKLPKTQYGDPLAHRDLGLYLGHNLDWLLEDFEWMMFALVRLVVQSFDRKTLVNRQ